MVHQFADDPANDEERAIEAEVRSGGMPRFCECGEPQVMHSLHRGCMAPGWPARVADELWNEWISGRVSLGEAVVRGWALTESERAKLARLAGPKPDPRDASMLKSILSRP